MKRINSGRQKWQSQANDTRIYTHTVYILNIKCIHTHMYTYVQYIYSGYEGIQPFLCFLFSFFASPLFMLPVLLTYEIATMICCKEPIQKIRNKYSQKSNCACAATVPLSTFMCLWAICKFPQSICCRKYVDRSWEYTNRSQTHEFGNWDWGRAIPRKGIYKWDFLCSVQ